MKSVTGQGEEAFWFWDPDTVAKTGDGGEEIPMVDNRHSVEDDKQTGKTADDLDPKDFEKDDDDS